MLRQRSGLDWWQPNSTVQVRIANGAEGRKADALIHAWIHTQSTLVTCFTGLPSGMLAKRSYWLRGKGLTLRCGQWFVVAKHASFRRWCVRKTCVSGNRMVEKATNSYGNINVSTERSKLFHCCVTWWISVIRKINCVHSSEVVCERKTGETNEHRTCVS